MSLWVPMIVVAAIGLARVTINWGGRIRYEQVRAATVTAVLEATPSGAAVYDIRADGTSLRIENSVERVRSESPGPAASVLLWFL